MFDFSRIWGMPFGTIGIDLGTRERKLMGDKSLFSQSMRQAIDVQ
jgi:hypothetical protein